MLSQLDGMEIHSPPVEISIKQCIDSQPGSFVALNPARLFHSLHLSVKFCKCSCGHMVAMYEEIFALSRCSYLAQGLIYFFSVSALTISPKSLSAIASSVLT